MPVNQFATVVVLLLLILLGAGGVLILLYEVIKQQGRLLLRLDAIDGRVGLRAPAGGPSEPAGLAVGTTFPSFKLSDVAGNEVALEDLRGKKVLLVNWSPQCGFCHRIAPDLAELHDDFEKTDVRLVLAAYGEAEANRKLVDEHGLKCLLLLQKGEQVLEVFKGLGTPVAYLLDEDGRVAKPLAEGAERIPALAREAVGAAPQNGHGRQLPIVAEMKTNAMARPKPQAEPGSGPGTELKKILARFGIKTAPDCPCNDRAVQMDRAGCDWCEQNIDTILDWLEEEARRRGTICIRPAARFLVWWAIAKARRDPITTKGRSASLESVASDLAPGIQDGESTGNDSEGAGEDASQPRKNLHDRLAEKGPPLENQIVRDGLRAGMPAPGFQLPDLYGRAVSLEDYRGRQVFLVFTDPHSDSCDQLAPHLVQFDLQHRDNGLALIMVAGGEDEENRRKVERYGFEFPVVLQEGWNLSKEYGVSATPVAVFIGEDGVIAREVAQGVDDILTLATDGLMGDIVPIGATS
jgi:peroxiredoxin